MSLPFRCFTPLPTLEIGCCVKMLFGEEEEEMDGQCDYFSCVSLGYPVKICVKHLIAMYKCMIYKGCTWMTGAVGLQ